MRESIKSWYSSTLGWTWYATEDSGGGYWFGYVDGDFPEWGSWSDEQLKDAGAVEIVTGPIPESAA